MYIYYVYFWGKINFFKVINLIVIFYFCRLKMKIVLYKMYFFFCLIGIDEREKSKV